jgi:uncharacterized protein (DUF1697 family)
MPRYVALFRGINVGKAKRIAMADLRQLLGTMGFSDVRTLLNSGNAVFTATSSSASALATRIRKEVADGLGVDARVIVKSREEVTAILGDNALADVATHHSRLLVAMVQDSKGIAVSKKIATQDWGNERVHLGRQAAYVWCADGILESKALVAVLTALADTATTRNWATLNKIHALMAP